MIGVENYNCVSIIPVTSGQHDLAQKLKTNKNSLGLVIAVSILALWSVNTFISLSSDLNLISLWKLLILVLLQTFLNTGLFITAHDGMHGLIYPFKSSVNDFIASMAVNLYALFSYQELRQRHFLHHLYPATDKDPDYHRDSRSSFWSWYVEFMTKYMNYQQLLKLLLLILVMVYIAQISWFNLIFCWLLPLILSSLQLFTFGTFLPHRRLEKYLPSISEIKSLNFSPFWSFIACYNFGYHWEHHHYPNLPWWQLSPIKIYLDD